jgi:hypothetical protein
MTVNVDMGMGKYLSYTLYLTCEYKWINVRLSWNM